MYLTLQQWKLGFFGGLLGLGLHIASKAGCLVVRRSGDCEIGERFVFVPADA